MSIFYLVSVAEETGFNLTLSVNLSLFETGKTGFLDTRPIYVNSESSDELVNLGSLVRAFVACTHTVW